MDAAASVVLIAFFNRGTISAIDIADRKRARGGWFASLLRGLPRQV